MSKIKSLTRGTKTRRSYTARLFCACFLMGALLIGCGPQGLGQSPTVAPTTQATEVATVAVPVEGTSGASQTPGAAEPSPTAAAPTAAAAQSPGPRATGTPPKSPMDLFNVYEFYLSNDVMVSRDEFDLDGTEPNEVLLTVTGPGLVLTNPFNSALSVISYDPEERKWDKAWQSEPVAGKASPLPPETKQLPIGLNGGLLLGTEDRIFALRTTTPDGKAHLHLYRWDRERRTGEPLRMGGVGDGPDRDAAFEGDLDANIIDLDDDEVWEVVVDNVTGVQIWKWDRAQSKFVPEGSR